uniref:Serine proteinase n=1 Tax=Hadrurus spadix TaxID=141984 RepID=A0A1W7RA07_9SCOR
MAVRSMCPFTTLSLLLLSFGSKQSVSQDGRPNTGLVFPEANTQYCRTRDGSAGSCVQISECKQDIDYQRGILPELCYWDNSRPIVCCLRNDRTETPVTVPDRDRVTSVTGCGKRTIPKDASRSPQIAGGRISLPSAWPWMISIHRSNFGIESFLCGGTMVNVRYILTAAHCFGRNGNDRRKIPTSRFVIRVGSNINEEGVAHRIKNIIVHEDYKVGQHYNDLAAIEVTELIKLSPMVQPICLPSSEMQGRQLVGRNVTVIGWGDQSFGGIRDRKLREVNISVIDRQQCDESYSVLSSLAIPRGITSQFLCAGDVKGGKDACQADSGGPLMMHSSDWTIVGIVSFGYGCAQKGYPGVYTQVASYLQWIKDNTRM